jgi:hypothetical protein
MNDPLISRTYTRIVAWMFLALAGCSDRAHTPVTINPDASAEVDAGPCESSEARVEACYAHAAPPQWCVPWGCSGPVERERDGGQETREAGLSHCWHVYDDDAGEVACCPD